MHEVVSTTPPQHQGRISKLTQLPSRLAWNEDEVCIIGLQMYVLLPLTIVEVVSYVSQVFANMRTETWY